jgi:hypothetical protein
VIFLFFVISKLAASASVEKKTLEFPSVGKTSARSDEALDRTPFRNDERKESPSLLRLPESSFRKNGSSVVSPSLTKPRSPTFPGKRSRE